MTSDKPVLAAIRAHLKLNASVSVAELARYSGLHYAQVVDVLGENAPYLVREKGRITDVRHRSRLKDQLWEAGVFWREEPANYGAEEVITFKRHDDLRTRLEKPGWYGGFGDSYRVSRIVADDANRAACREAGLIPASEVVLDDRLWIEGPVANG